MTGRPLASTLHGLPGTADLAAAFDVNQLTVWRWNRRHGIGHRTEGDRGNIVFTDRDVTAAGALALLGTDADGWSPTPAVLRLATAVVQAVWYHPRRFVVAIPAWAVTMTTADGVVAWLRYLDEPVVTVIDLDRAAPIARDALARLTAGATP